MKKIIFATYYAVKRPLVIFYNQLVSKFHAQPKVMLIDETIQYILDNKCSVSRYGDGEIWIAVGGEIIYQKQDAKLMQRLQEVLSSDEAKNNHIVTVPDIFEDRKLALRTEVNQKFWREHLSIHRKDWYRFMIKDKQYFNTAISRFYMPIQDKEKSKTYISLLKQIWQGKDIVIVEGKQSRLGMGNDLFSECKSVGRITGPPENAFDKYDAILSGVQKVDKNKLILIALGPTATILAYDLHKLGYWAIDLGNIDIEYEWFKMGTLVPVKIATKYTHGTKDGNINIVDAKDDLYQSQILFNID
ncbi:SP_1767 family glycosyltransferase [Flavobacterium sp. SUN052]|uniref:SP_1767 family glycosyltransferase n=1 Tax=Flavobacterium sp. SUN052 TaxID=3002441 RepID=UPI00237E8CD7|nr:SP_1767 family glycosyltransferase [Flavobacterium sp. SUN052]MEC4004426.1 SP_1767 family glycosyltransferase [Flavobacterium sp. SUN052]